jgi:hypothetical protein
MQHKQDKSNWLSGRAPETAEEQGPTYELIRDVGEATRRIWGRLYDLSRVRVSGCQDDDGLPDLLTALLERVVARAGALDLN